MAAVTSAGSRMSELPVLSVIVPVRDGAPWLEEQLRALAAQRCDQPWEVVVADNGSTDGSKELALGWAAAHPRFRVVDASASQGAPAARNAGVRAARGSLLAFCDADDVVLQGWLACCLDALQHADVIAGVFDFWSLNGIPASAATPAAMRQLGFLPAGLGANLAVRREVFDQVGGFSEELLAGEDIDLCWRLQLRGFRFDVAGCAVVAKRERAAFGQVYDQAFTYGLCGPVLYRRYRTAGAHRDLGGALKSWLWLVIASPLLLNRDRRLEWARTAGMRIGRIAGSVREGVCFP